MKKSLEIFMKAIIDYAGLFPPADLSLDEAIQNYAQYRSQKDRWMLSRFIIPATRLAELEPYADDFFTSDQPFDFSILGKATGTVDDFQFEIENVAQACKKFNAAYPGRVTTEVLEIKLPEEAAFSRDVDMLQQLMDDTARKLNQSSETPSSVFYEGLLDEGWEKDIESIMKAISSHNRENNLSDDYNFAAFKLRCGGVEAHHFPTAKQLANVLQQARKYNVAIKFTAGLHHPVRGYVESVQTKMHGFINVFGGAMLGYAHDLSVEELEESINEEDADQFVFTDEEFRWRDFSIPTQEIEDLRRVALISYGSCSFVEPREDLKNLQLY